MEIHKEDIEKLVRKLLEYEKQLYEFQEKYESYGLEKWAQYEKYGIMREEIPKKQIPTELTEERFIKQEYNRLVRKFNTKKQELINYIRDVM